tara:strand:- start:50 stop:487 length:438 start_codon:yes stop_codon:yes gene_type:complete
MSKYTSNTHEKRYRNHFDDFDLYKRDLSNMRLKREVERNKHDRMDHFKDMKESASTPCEKNVNYKIYKPIYNIYKDGYQQQVNDHKNQLNSYQRIIDHLDEMLDSGTLSDTQLENTRSEQREILKEMDSVREKISTITSVDSTIK